MADLFPVFKTDGSRADTLCVMSPTDFVFFAVHPSRTELRAFCETNPFVGHLTSIVEAINTELDAQRDNIWESLICHGEAVSPTFCNEPLYKKNLWVSSWVGTRLQCWKLRDAAQVQQADLFGVAYADLPQVLLSGMTKDFRLEQRSYTDLLYRDEVGMLTPRGEITATRFQKGIKYRVQAEDYTDGQASAAEALGGQGVEDRDDLYPGEVRQPVRERSEAADPAG